MVPELFDLQGKVAVVTGGGRGVGVMCAKALLNYGAEVIVTSRKPPADTAFGALCELGRCSFIQVDLAGPDGVEEMVAALSSSFEAIDILVNNAGVTWGAPLGSYPAASWDKVLRLDLAVPFFLTQALLPLLEEAGRRHPPARVVNIGSVDGHAVGPFDNFAYSAAKGGLHQLTRVLAYRLAGRAITVNCIAPGPVRTKMTESLIEEVGPSLIAANPLGRLTEASDIEGALVFVTAPAGSYVTGAVIPLDGGYHLGSWSAAGGGM